jgi:dihydrofolate reductase
MAKLIYLTLMSLDGYVEDAAGSFDWGQPDAEVHGFVNDLLRPLGTHLYGRRMYEVMTVWETMHERPGQPPHILDFAAIWQAVDKVVFSATLQKVSSARTRIEREFDPEALRRLKGQARRDLSVSGPQLASQAFRAGLVDECHLFVAPVVVGAGKRALPAGLKRSLELLELRRFANGMVYLHYR